MSESMASGMPDVLNGPVNNKMYDFSFSDMRGARVGRWPIVVSMWS